MKRCILALVLLTACIGPAPADYLLIKLNENQLDTNTMLAKSTGGKGLGDPLKGKDTTLRPAAGPGSWIYGILEFNRDEREILGPFQIFRKFGRIVMIVRQEKGLVEVMDFERQSVVDQFRDMKKREGESKEEALLHLATWAVEHEMLNESVKMMIKMRAINPARQAISNYEQLEVDFTKMPSEPRISAGLQSELKGYKSKSSKHYVIYYKEGTEGQIDQRLVKLEYVYRNFFYWFALQDNVPMPHMPKHRLVVLLEEPEEYSRKHNEWIQHHDQASGFTVRRENVVVLCHGPNSVFLKQLKRNLDAALRNHRATPDDVINGAIWDDKHPNSYEIVGKRKVPRATIANLQTLTLLQRSMEYDVELASISREGSRQLLGATGMFARNVAIPEWAHGGLARFFEIPPVHLHLGFGGTRNKYLRIVKGHIQDEIKEHRAKKIPFKNAEILTNLCTDRYFRHDNNLGLSAGNEDLGPAMSWALIHYLASQRKLNYLHNYAELLNQMPRHAPLHPQTLESCFTRAFNLNDPRDERRLVADEWINAINLTDFQNQAMEDFFFVPGK